MKKTADTDLSAEMKSLNIYEGLGTCSPRKYWNLEALKYFLTKTKDFGKGQNAKNIKCN